MAKTAYLALGTNVGEREENLRRAISRLEARKDVRVTDVSSVYETDPVGYVDQPAFLNMVVRVATELTPQDLLLHMQSVEGELGRVREMRWGPRTIDVDLLLYEGFAADGPDLIVPHPRMFERAFVLVPLLDVLSEGDWLERAQAADVPRDGIRIWKEAEEFRPQPFLLLEFADRSGQIRPYLFAKPLRVIRADQVDEVIPALREIERAVDEGCYAAGYLSYEAAPAFDPAMIVCAGAQMPLLWFGIYEQASEHVPAAAGEFSLTPWEPNITREQYDEGIAAIQERIRQGDTYQTNFTLRMRSSFRGDDYAFYRQLARGQKGSYGAYLNLGRHRILSASPELFFRWANGRIQTKPMKGTAKRGRYSDEDRAQAAWLAESDKDQAENVMIVDLLRNDLGRVSDQGTVQVKRLFEIEQYPTVWQMTSTVEAQPRQGVRLTDVMSALFPCGSITGAPKISTMGLIAELEGEPREAYCGTIGMITPQKEAVFSVAIRTVRIDMETGQAEYGVGGGITWDSTATGEYDEVLTKARLLHADPVAFDLLETLRLEGGDYILLDRHVERMKKSAAFFRYPFDEAKVRAALAETAAHEAGTRRVRVLLGEGGEVRVEASPLGELGSKPQRVALAKTPVSSQDRFLFHKTTHRRVYEKHRRDGLFDVLLFNEHEELTEFTIGNLVVQLDGVRYTPPVDCGLLAGTLRDELIADGDLQERVLRLEDLAQAEGIWLINSVRGFVPVVFE